MSVLTRVTVLSASAAVGSVLGLGLYHGLAAGPASTATSVPVADPTSVVTTYAGCVAPARLVEGECVTTVQRTAAPALVPGSTQGFGTAAGSVGASGASKREPSSDTGRDESSSEPTQDETSAEESHEPSEDSSAHEYEYETDEPEADHTETDGTGH